MEVFLQILIGIGLAATCGFRIFVPLFVMGIAGLSGYIEIGSGFGWIASYPAVIVFGIATVIEIAAYFIPIVDNILDQISIPVSIVAGIIVFASVVADIDPILKWTLAVIAGGGVATATSLLSNGVHAVSTLTTAGAANPGVSAVESLTSVFMTILSIVLPVVSLIVIVLITILIVRYLQRAKKKVPPPATA